MPVSDDDLAHLLRRTEFVVRPDRFAFLKTKATLAEVVDDILNISLNGNPPLPAYFQSEDTASGWNQYVDGVLVLAEQHARQATPVPGEDDAVLARSLRQCLVRCRRELPHDAADCRCTERTPSATSMT